MELPSGSENPRIVGSKAWAEAGGPPLSVWQKAQQLLNANLAYLEEVPGEMRWALASRGLMPHRPVAPVGVQPLPETKAVEATIRYLELYAEGETEIVNHSYRTFHFADILHRQAADAPAMDREVLAVAMLLHDVGIYPKAAAELPGGDFTVKGAQLARRIGEEVGWAPYRIDLAAQAVTLNANARVTRHWGPEAYYGRLAPLVDAVGQCWKVHAKDARPLFAEHPAGDLGPAIVAAVRQEVQWHPGGRFALFRPLFPFLVWHCKSRWCKRLNVAG